MMRKTILLILIFILSSSKIFGQNEEINSLLLYKTMMEKSDSMLSAGKISEIDSKNIESLAKKLDEEEPSKYFEASLDYLKKSKYNESAFLYHLGKMRMLDYNKSGNGYYQPSGDTDVFLEEGIFMFLATDIDNYSRVLKMVVNYYNQNDYSYISKSKNYKKLAHPTNYPEIIQLFETKREESKQELKKGREEMTSRILEYLPLLNEPTSNTK